MKSIRTQFTRSNLVESEHYIKVLIKNSKGRVLLSSNHDDEFIYPRSAIKIFQAIPFIQSRAVENFNLSKKIIALACSSHRGEEFHIKELKNWTKKINISINDLQCGTHHPLNDKAKIKILKSKKKINQLYNNCAGKHLAMISSCLVNKYKIKNYTDLNHPHQIKIRKIFQKFSGIKIPKINFGIDGCSAPQYALKIKYISKMLTNLIKSYKNKHEFNNEIRTLIDAITSCPKYIGGSDSLDSIIMKISSKRIFCKGGAEGVFLFIDLEKEISGVLKVVDGNERAIPSAVYDIFKKFKIMNSEELRMYNKFYNFEINNHANKNIGFIRTKFI